MNFKILLQKPSWGYIKQAFKRVGAWCQMVLHLIEDLFSHLTPVGRVCECGIWALGYVVAGALCWWEKAPVSVGLASAFVLTVGAPLVWAWLGYIKVHRRVCVVEDEEVPVRYPCTEEDYQADLARVQQLGYPVLRIEPSALPGIVHHYYISRCEGCQREFNALTVASKRLCTLCEMWQEGSEEVAGVFGLVRESEEVEG